MRFLPHILVLLLLCSLVQATAAQTVPNDINLYDKQGKPHGVWYTSTPAVRGEPAETVLGTYEHGQKAGLWYVSDGRGNMISIETFRFNVRDGEAKYFENGQLTCIGHYRGLNPRAELDTVLIVDPLTGDERLVSVPTERGSVRHGSWRFYDEFSGRLVKEEQYQIDELIYKKDFAISPSDSSHYQSRNKRLPHLGNTLAPASRFRQKAPAKTLIGD